MEGGKEVLKEGTEQELAKNKIKEGLMLIPNYLKLLYRLIRDSRVKAVEKATLLATVAYVLSPLDFLPDMIPFVGQIDDVLLVALILQRFMNSVDRHLLYEYWDGEIDLLENIEQVLAYARFFLPGNVYNKIVRKSKETPKQTIDVEYEVK